MSAYAGLNRAHWEHKGAHVTQYAHIDQEWQDIREQPDRSGVLDGPGNVHGLGGVSMSDCPLARIRLGEEPQEAPPDRPDYPIGSPRDIARYKAEFDKRDYEGDGEIETKELALPEGQVMKALGRELSAAAAKMLIQAIDTDGSGSVDFDEFIQGCFGVRQEVFRAMRTAIMEEDLAGMKALVRMHGVSNFTDDAGDLDIIHVAAAKGFPPMLSLLLESHADPNQHAGGQLKRTPLHFAAESSHPQRARAITALLAAGAEPRARDSYGYTALDRFAPESKAAGFDWLDDPESMERFREHRRDHPEAYGYHVLPPISNQPRDKHKHRHKHRDGSPHRHTKHHHRHHHHNRDRGNGD